MTDEEAIVLDFRENTGNYWETHSDYDRVTALLIYWEEDDLNVAPEVEGLRDLLEGGFGFSTSTFKIPSKNSRIQLQCELSIFLRQYSLERRSLVIVYYAGHSDSVSECSQLGYSHWRA